MNTTDGEDPIVRAIESLPDAPIAPALARDVAAKARLALEAKTSLSSRLDHFFMDRLMPAALGALALGYAAGLIEFYGRVYGG
ncbi:hypothetical protein [Polyangium sp. 6x1]|uniref:hypothetical protein n=1 Tax=Polyangium sp. 6x1 TaxID=3042689 RepID=UPI0024829073|nr:hypothetical protein [Polyangium sp. 6x1]MDI1443308.1 hypothetical protein [Polyangium sp. 6x1]